MIGVIPYHREIATLLEREEGVLWEWFGSDAFSPGRIESLRLELLKTTYRLKREDAESLYAGAALAAGRLGLDLPVVLYQAQGRQIGPNASLVFMPDEVSIVLHGAVLDLLDADEALALFGHEIAHHLLYTIENGRYLTAARCLDWCVGEPDCDGAYRESRRLYQLATELFADRGALKVVGRPEPAISALLKVSTGSRTVTPGAYLEQAEEILAKARAGSEGVTHPELYLRAHALDRWARDETSGQAIEHLLTGPLEADRLDIAGQKRLTAATEALVSRLVRRARLRGESTRLLARRYFPDQEFRASSSVEDGADSVDDGADSFEALREELAGFGASCRVYFSYVLLDFATADADCWDEFVLDGLDVAKALGIHDVYEPLLRKETKLTKDALAKLRRAYKLRQQTTGQADARND